MAERSIGLFPESTSCNLHRNEVMSIHKALRPGGSVLPVLFLAVTAGAQTQPANLGLAVLGDGIRMKGDLTALLVSESQQGVDLNGDGGIAGSVLHVYRASTDTVTNVGIAVPSFHHSGEDLLVLDEKVVFIADENNQDKQDLNGDGDNTDHVLHVYDALTGIVTNTQLAVYLEGMHLFEADDRFLAALVRERDASADWNGDGDTLDWAVFVYDLQHGTMSRVPVAAGSFGSFAAKRLAISNGTVVFQARESDGAVDHNGDGDLNDHVLFAYHAVSGSLRNIGVEGLFLFADKGRFVFTTPETSQGNTDLNGDGDTLDAVLHGYDARTGMTNNLGLTVDYVFEPEYDMVDGVVGVILRESVVGDLDGDGFPFQSYFHLYDLTTGNLRNTQLRVVPDRDNFVLDGRTRSAAVLAVEVDTDLNGDGDSMDQVVRIVDFDGPIRNLRRAVDQVLEFNGELLAVAVMEASDSNFDRNGDGDTLDEVLFLSNLGAYELRNEGKAIVAPAPSSATVLSISGQTAVFTINEAAQGGTDLNSDGDVFDQVLGYVDKITGERLDTGLAITRDVVIDGRTIGFLVEESLQGGTDLNGDGDGTDRVFHVIRLSPTGGSPFCFGDGAAGAECPCDPSASGFTGCDNMHGGVLLATQDLAFDGQDGGTVTLLGTGYPPAYDSAVVVLRSRQPALPAVPFGNGLRCVATDTMVALAPVFASSGSSVHPIVHQGEAGSWYYQLLYRNVPATYCDPQAVFNTSNGYRIVW